MFFHSTRRAIVLICVFFCLVAADSQAATAGRFVGWYKVKTTTMPQPQTEFLLIDNGTLLELWTKYSDNPLPDDLQQYKDQPTILSGFTERDFLIICFEAYAMIYERYLKITRGQTDYLELLHRDDGDYDMATMEQGKADRYLLAPPTPSPTFSPAFVSEAASQPRIHLDSSNIRIISNLSR